MKCVFPSGQSEFPEFQYCHGFNIKHLVMEQAANKAASPCSSPLRTFRLSLFLAAQRRDDC